MDISIISKVTKDFVFKAKAENIAFTAKAKNFQDKQNQGQGLETKDKARDQGHCSLSLKVRGHQN